MAPHRAMRRWKEHFILDVNFKGGSRLMMVGVGENYLEIGTEVLVSVLEPC